MSCSICLENYTSPVATPCGHIFCLSCLITSSQTSADATNAPCPTCRQHFSLVTPNPLFIPEKYHQFIDCNIRRIYIEDPKARNLQNRVTRLEDRVKMLEVEKELLMKRCEASMDMTRMFAAKERQARLRCEELQNDLWKAEELMAFNSKSSVIRRSSLKVDPPLKGTLRNSSKVERESPAKDNNRVIKVNALPKTIDTEGESTSLSLKRRRVTRAVLPTPTRLSTK